MATGGGTARQHKRNESVSFYAQGGVLGLVLDLKLREATGGGGSLDTLMTMLYEDFPLGGPGYDFLAMKARVQYPGRRRTRRGL